MKVKIIIAITLLLCCSHVYSEENAPMLGIRDSQFFTKEPEDNTLAENSTFVLDCGVAEGANWLAYEVKWYMTGVNINPDLYPRYEWVAGSAAECITTDECSLRINGATFEDNTDWKCQITALEDGETEPKVYDSNVAAITIAIPPRNMYFHYEGEDLSSNETVTESEGEEFRLTCVMNQTNPSPENYITWYRQKYPYQDNQEEPIENTEYYQWEDETTKKINAQSSISYESVNRSDHKTRLRCALDYVDEGERYFNNTITIEMDIQYPPTISPMPKLEYNLDEKAYFQLDCETDANPEPHTYRWILNNETTVRSERKLTFQEVTTDNEGLYHCEAENILGKDVSPQVEITVGPQVKVGMIVGLTLGIIALITIVGVIAFLAVTKKACFKKKETKSTTSTKTTEPETEVKQLDSEVYSKTTEPADNEKVDNPA